MSQGLRPFTLVVESWRTVDTLPRTAWPFLKASRMRLADWSPDFTIKRPPRRKEAPKSKAQLGALIIARVSNEPKPVNTRPMIVVTFPESRMRVANPEGSLRGAAGGSGPMSVPGGGGMGPPHDSHWLIQFL